MKRDFSERARQELLSMVRQVEQEKLSNFTDWVGDRWLDYQSWIGALDINRFIQNVNDYHRKVIDQNNATEASINAIFERVNGVDGGYRARFDGLQRDLSGWKNAIDRLSAYIQPGRGSFGGLLTEAGLRYFRWQLEKENQVLIRERLYQIVDGAIVLNEALIEDCLKRYPASMTNEDITALRELASVLSQNVQVGQAVTCTDAAKLLEILSGTIDNINARAGDHEGVGFGKDVLGYVAPSSGSSTAGASPLRM